MKRNSPRRLPLLMLILCLSLLLTACARPAPAAPGGVQVTDMAGRNVTVPKSPKSICVLDPFSAQVAVMLGAGDRMPTTINVVKRSLLLQSICPALKNAAVVKTNGTMNAETILAKKTDLLIVGPDTWSNAGDKAKLDAVGIPYLVVSYASMADQMKVVTLLGRALQNEAMARKYVDYYQSCIDRVRNGRTKGPGGTIRLYHSVEEAVRTDDSGSLSADWIGLLGVDNVALDAPLSMTGDKAYATLEQIYAWDPDVIIANETGVADYILTDAKWQGLRAVADKKVYQIPIGISRWGHPTSIETPLAILWLANLLYPSEFTAVIRTEMASFYKTFFNYTLSLEESDAIVSGYGIRTPKTTGTN